MLELDFMSCQICVLPSPWFELTPLIHCSTNRLSLKSSALDHSTTSICFYYFLALRVTSYPKTPEKRAGNPNAKKRRETRLRMRAPKGSTLPTSCTTTLVRKTRGVCIDHSKYPEGGDNFGYNNRNYIIQYKWWKWRNLALPVW